MKEKDTPANNGFPLRKCSTCNSGVECSIVHRYVWKSENGVDVEINDAKMIICPVCGESPINAIEADRWESLAEQTERDINPKYSGVKCHVCGVPREDVGEFYYLGWEREEKICGECFSKRNNSRSVGSGTPSSGAIPKIP